MTDINNFQKDKMKEFFNSGKTLDYNFRINALKKLRNALIKYEEELTKAVNKDFGKAYFETYMTEILTVADELDFFLKNLKKLMEPDRVATPIAHFKSKSRVFYEPYGIVLIISPWNYPITLAFSPLIGGIAAGNCVVLKPSSKTKHTGDIIEKIIKETFPPEYVTVVRGSSDVTHELIREDLDYVVFTGSPKAGKDVATTAANFLTPITLELGGKSPTIVWEDGDLENSSKRILWGECVNAGQTCIAPDYLLLHKNVKEEFIELLKKDILEFYGENPLENPDLPSIINEKNYNRLKSYLKEKEIIFGGRYDDEKLKIEPTLILNPDLDSKIMKDEIFGPILPIIIIEDIEETIEIIRARPKPLAFYLFSKDEEKIDYYIENVSFGNGCINDTLIQFANSNLPFGGVGQSGIGEYHGKYSFETFSNKKGMSRKTDLFDIELRYPPYTEKKMKLLKYYINRKLK